MWFFRCVSSKENLQAFQVLALSSEKAMAPHSSTLAWKIPWTDKPGGLQSMGSHRVGHDWGDLEAAAALSSFSYDLSTLSAHMANPKL